MAATSPFDLCEFSMNAGSHKTITFAVYDSNEDPVSLSGGTTTWYLSPYGNSSAVVTKATTSGSASNQFIVDLVGGDTSSLSGKFIQQYKHIDASGSSFRPSSGIITIFPSSE